MNQWLEYSLKCRKGQAGFALPVAIGMGLIILLVGLTMLLRSQDSQVSAIAQKDTAKSLNAAETGVNEIRALMNQHRAIAVYPACENRDSSGTCLDSDPTPSWRLPDNITSLDTNLALSCNNYTDAQKNAAKAEISDVSQRNWQPVDPNDPSQGEYRLLDYLYSGTPGSPTDGEIGTLSVQGRVNSGQPSESISQLEVEIPLEDPLPGNVNPPRDSSGTYRIAGMWVQTAANTSQVKADILGDCDSSISAEPAEHVKKLKDLSMPPAPIPSSGIELTDAPSSLPRSGDPIEGTSYKYRFDTLTSGFTVDNSDLTQPIKNIEIWVKGEINLEGKVIRHSCGSRTIEDCGPFQVKIYSEEDPTFPNKSITLNQGTTICNAFIHTPGYDVTYNSTGGSPSNWCFEHPTDPTQNTNNTGVFWINSWNGGNNSSDPVLDLSRGFWSQDPYNVASTIEYFAVTNPIQTWLTKEKTTN
ncbi:hypothetical protein [Acaryochloris sp. IP29b_bin.137]|uniref:hypothetical protein n=1 Tax=Acaryochloris sp. IP29b_bin.137 TaxID=2969217 RepID=UPI00261732A3|nr:hypothetical protein [Acaryochloris sp. IP29b_bin.137]